MAFEDVLDVGDKYVLEDCIANGVFGKVFRATDTNTTRKVAVKIQSLYSSSNRYLEEEYKILKDFTDHANLPDFYGVYKSNSDIWFVLELCNGCTVRNLVNGLLDKNRHMAEEHIAHILKEVIKALIYLHKNSIIHRNVRGSSILLTKEGEVKLCDFGISHCLDSTLDRTNTCIGSPCWMAPEVVMAKPYNPDTEYDNRVDVWALGITTIELGDGKAPYEDMHPTRALFHVVRNPPPTLAMQSQWSNNYNDFVSECLVKNPDYRPFMEEVIDHPFLTNIPENNYYLSLELKAILQDLKDVKCKERSCEISVHGDFLKRSTDNEMEKMYTEDLAALDKINEENILSELQARMEKGEFQTFVGDILLVLNPNKKKDISGRKYHEKYKCKSRSDNAPHIYAVADAAYQDALHHQLPQKILLSGEAGSGKTSNFLHLIDHLVYLGENTNINVRRISNAVKLIHSLTHASTPFNDYSTRCILKASIIYSNTAKVTGAEFGVHFLEKWRVSSVEMSQANYHIFYYIYDGLREDGLLENYKLEPSRQYRYLRIEKEKCLSQPRNNIEENIIKYLKLKETMEDFAFSQDDIDNICKIIAAILILGDVKFKNTEDGLAKIDNSENVDLVAELLQLDEKKLAWSLCNYCLIHKGTAVKRRLCTEEARDARDVLANTLYSRMIDYIISTINHKFSIGRAIFGEKYLVSVLDYFGFECFETNHLPQLFINCFNEQLQYHYLQRTFVWENLEMTEDGIDCTPMRFHDNKMTLDQLLSKSEGVLTYIDEASKMGVGGKYVTEFLERQDRQYVASAGRSEFSVSHYTGKVTYNVKEMPDRNRDYLPPEVIETMRNSENPVIKLLFTSKLNKLGNLIIDRGENEGGRKRDANNKKNKIQQQYSQIRKMRTSASVFRAISLELLKELSAGAGYGGTHFVRCIRTSLDEKPEDLNVEIIKQQLRALAVVETAKLRRDGFPYRVNFSEFLRRYKFLAFDFNENVEIKSENCRLLLIRLKIEGWAIGKEKVFLKYYNEEYLARLYETQVRKIVKIQSILRGFLAQCKLKHNVADVEKNCVNQIRRRSSALTEEDAAVIIQHAYRKVTKRKNSTKYTAGKFDRLDESEVEFIRPYAKKWRSKSIFEVLLQYRSYCFQELFNFSQQVHLYNQKAFYDLEQLEHNVDVNEIDRNALVSSWLGEVKPYLMKMNFRLDEIPYYDTSAMCDSLTNIGASIDKTETWDAPYRYKEMISSRSMSTDTDSNSCQNKYELEDIINISYNRDPDKPIETLPAIKDEEPKVKEENDTTDENDEVADRQTEEPPLSKAEKDMENKAVRNKSAKEDNKQVKILKKAPEDTINSNTKPANKDFDYIKPSKPKTDPVAELRNMARNENVTSDDEPPFNFKGMLRKTDFKRDSLKKAIEEFRTISFAKPELKKVNKEPNTKTANENKAKAVKIEVKDSNNTLKQVEKPKTINQNRNVQDENKKNVLEGVNIDMELFPGFFISGIEVEL